MIRARLSAWQSWAGRIRGRLTGLALLAALPIFAMAGMIAWQAFEAIARSAQERAALLDGQALAHYQAAVDAVAADLVKAAPSVIDHSCNPGLTQRDYGLLAIDVDGRVVCRGGALPALPPPPYAWFEHVRGGAQVVTQPFGPPGWTVVAVPTSNGGAIAAMLPSSWTVTQVLSDDLPQAGDAVWLFDSNGATLASRGDAAVALPLPGTMDTLLAGGQLALRAEAGSGARYAYAATLLPGGWRLVVATSAEREHAAALNELLLRVAELAALLVAGVAAVVIGADVAFGQPLRRLSAAVRRWQGGGSFDPGDLAGAPDEVLQLAASFQESTDSLRQKELELSRAHEKQNLLVMEVHHRVKNNLQVIASLLNLQGSRIRVPEAQAEFQAARDRVRALATLHRHLYADGELHTINMRSFLEELCGQLFQALGETLDQTGAEGNARIQLVIEAPELRMSSDQAVPLALIVTEAVTNSVRYAFPGGRTGRIEVRLTEHDGVLDLDIRDDGVGIEAGRQPEPGARDGIGLQLIRGFSRQLGAKLSVEGGQGTRYAVRLTGMHAGAAGLDGAAAQQETVA